MRRVVLITAASLLALTACGRKPTGAPKPPATPGAPPASSVSPTSLPQRAPGLWEQKVSAAGRTQVSQICLDRAAERRFTPWGQHAGKSGCSPPRITPRPGGGWNFASTCDMGPGGRISTEGAVTGDFARRYSLSARSTVSGASAPEMNGAHEMTLEASWKGPCPAGMQPGDMLLPGGMKINMMKLPTP